MLLAAVLERLRRVTLPTQYAQMEKPGASKTFAALQVTIPALPGYFFNDSDVYKWAEAAAWALAAQPDPALQAQLDELIGLFEAAQQPDGYLNTYYTLQEPGKRGPTWG